ncbi:MAG: hypothetical protein AAFZ15_12790 [Bacteroidota bacterium]
MDGGKNIDLCSVFFNAEPNCSIVQLIEFLIIKKNNFIKNKNLISQKNLNIIKSGIKVTFDQFKEGERPSLKGNGYYACANQKSSKKIDAAK